MKFTKIIINKMNNLRHTINQMINESLNEKIYYHGRKQGKAPRSMSDKRIYITDDLQYASEYSDGKVVYMYTIPFDMNRIFSLKNRSHLALLSKIVDSYIMQSVIKDSGIGNELDWSTLGNISTEDFEEPEDAFQHLGFFGLRLQERTNVESIYIFDENLLTFKGLLNI